MNMYQLGILAPANQEVKDLDVFQYNGIQAHVFRNVEEAEAHRTELDSLVFLDTESSFLETCDVIVSLRQKIDTLLWIIAKDASKNMRIAYMKLGAIPLTSLVEDVEEFVALLTNVLSLSPNAETAGEMIQTGAKSKREQELEKCVSLNPSNWSVCYEDKEVLLTKLEFRVLALLSKKRGTVVTYEEFSSNIWLDEQPVETVKYRISNIIFLIRKKLAGFGAEIRTVNSKGYMLV